jgi:hypothetical protein
VEVEMKCAEIDLLEYTDGVPSEEVRIHVESCKRCQRESKKVSRFSRLISDHYLEGIKAEQELENRLRTINCEKMERLPFDLQKKVAALKEKNLGAKIKRVLGKAKQSEERFVESLLRPRLQFMPASPKDITKPKKKTEKKKKSKRS